MPNQTNIHAMMVWRACNARSTLSVIGGFSTIKISRWKKLIAQFSHKNECSVQSVVNELLLVSLQPELQRIFFEDFGKDFGKGSVKNP